MVAIDLVIGNDQVTVAIIVKINNKASGSRMSIEQLSVCRPEMAIAIPVNRPRPKRFLTTKSTKKHELF
jgi:hypothetical protein